MKLFNKSGNEIKKWQDWERPKCEDHWVEGRSALELSKSWFRNSIVKAPYELTDILLTRFKDISFISAQPEFVTALPERGEGRNHDLLIKSKIDGEKATICIEAKADESYGDYNISDYYTKKLNQRQGGGDNTKVPERIMKLMAMLPISLTDINKSPIANNGYQLLTGLTGTSIQAKIDRSDFAVFIVHEFHTDKTNPDKIEKNSLDYTSFVKAILKDDCIDTSYGVLNGPILVNGVNCFIGRILA